MIRHIVCLTPAPGQDDADLPGILARIGDLREVLDGFDGFAAGANHDIEGRSGAVSHVFTCDFADRAALDRYAADARHRALGAELVRICGPAGIAVFDMEVTDG